MFKIVLLACVSVVLGSFAVNAQTSTSRPVDTDARQTIDRSITATGQTVPNPGASQSAGTTPLDRGIQRRDDQLQNSICRGC